MHRLFMYVFVHCYCMYFFCFVYLPLNAQKIGLSLPCNKSIKDELEVASYLYFHSAKGFPEPLNRDQPCNFLLEKLVFFFQPISFDCQVLQGTSVANRKVSMGGLEAG